jgi:nucleotide-binding universal stress UspA family protein
MVPFKRILFPVDYSDRCQFVIPYVQEMARHFSAELTLVHAYGVGAIPYTGVAVVNPYWGEEMREQEERELRAFVKEAFPGQQVKSILKEGEPGWVIDTVVQQEETDLVMMPTHGHGPVRRLLLGSVTTKVLHDVRAAVWTGAGRMAEHQPHNTSYQSILCAVDLGEETETVVRAAAALADSYHARLSLVNVVELPPPSFDADFTPYKSALIDAANDRLKEVKTRLGIDASHMCLDGIAADCIAREATEKGVDLIVTGRGNAQGGLSRIWSRLYAVVRESPCPVLSI